MTAEIINAELCDNLLLLEGPDGRGEGGGAGTNVTYQLRFCSFVVIS